MSLESISALRQLSQVREQSATMQNDNLEKVQGSVQQSGVAEAQRSDNLSLQEAKAQYEVELSKATLDRIQSQLAREQTSLVVTQISTALTIGFAVADTAINMARDFKGGQKLGNPSSQQESMRDLNEDEAESSINGNDIYSFGNGKNDDKDAETVYRTVLAGNTNNVSNFDGAVIKKSDIEKEAGRLGLTGVSSFKGLYESGPEGKSAAEKLFNDNGRPLNSNDEVSSAMRTFNKTLDIAVEKEGKINGVAMPERNRNEIRQSLEAKLKDEGKIDNGISAKDGAKYVFNGIVSLASTIVPQIQALMAAKEKVAQTEIELQAAIEKLAAAQKKLRQIQDLIVSVGGDNLGNANGQAETGLS